MNRKASTIYGNRIGFKNSLTFFAKCDWTNQKRGMPVQPKLDSLPTIARRTS